MIFELLQLNKFSLIVSQNVNFKQNCAMKLNNENEKKREKLHLITHYEAVQNKRSFE